MRGRAFCEAGTVSKLACIQQYPCLHRMLAFLEAVLDLDDGEYAKVAMLDCIADARIAGVDNWFHTLFALLTYVNGGIAPADALHHDGTVDVDEVPRLVDGGIITYHRVGEFGCRSSYCTKQRRRAHNVQCVVPRLGLWWLCIV